MARTPSRIAGVDPPEDAVDGGVEIAEAEHRLPDDVERAATPVMRQR